MPVDADPGFRSLGRFAPVAADSGLRPETQGSVFRYGCEGADRRPIQPLASRSTSDSNGLVTFRSTANGSERHPAENSAASVGGLVIDDGRGNCR